MLRGLWERTSISAQVYFVEGIAGNKAKRGEFLGVTGLRIVDGVGPVDDVALDEAVAMEQLRQATDGILPGARSGAEPTRNLGKYEQKPKR